MQNLKNKPYTHMNSTSIMGRRRLVFQFLSQGLTAKRMLPLINEHYNCSLSTVHRDIRKMDSWLPGLLHLEEGEGDRAFARLIGLLQVSQKRLSQLCYAADNSNAQVGAARALAIVSQAEAELRMDAGQLRREPVMLKNYVDIDMSDLDEAAVGAIVQNFMDDEARRLRNPDMVEPPLGGATAAEKEEVPNPYPLSPNGSVWADAPQPNDPGCSDCRLFGKSCEGPTPDYLDENGKCIHIQHRRV